MSYGLGIDVGTIFARAAVGSHGQTRIVAVSEDSASVFPAASPRSDGDLLIRRGVLVRGAGNGGTRLAEPIPLVLGGQARRGVPLLARALRSVIDTATAAEGEAPERVVLTCPAVWGPVRRRQLVDASRQVGLDPVTVLSEPEAATAFFVAGQRLAETDVVLVYDLGAVRVDLTVVRVTGTGTEILGQPEALEGVGGIDVDDVVLAHVDRVLDGALSALDPADPNDRARLEAARAACVRAKEALSENESTVVVLELAAGTFRVSMNRTLFEPMIRSGVESTLTALRRSMASAGVAPADLAAVVLVGGSSRIPLVGRTLAASLRRPVLTHTSPQDCVALGAAETAVRGPGGDSLPEVVAVPAPVPVPPAPTENRPVGAGPVAGTRRRLMALVAALALLAGWTTYVALVPLIEAPDPEVTFSAGRAAGTTLEEPTRETGTAGAARGRGLSASAPTVHEPPAVTRSVTTTAPLKVTSTRKASSSRAGASRAERGTGRLVGPGGRCLDLRGLPMEGTRVQAVDCRPSPSQIWTATSSSLRVFGQCLQATANTAGARVVIGRCDGRAAQQWQVVSGRIENATSHTCLEVSESFDGRTRLVTATCRRVVAQGWALKT